MVDSASYWKPIPRQVVYHTKYRRVCAIIFGVIIWCCVVLPVFYVFKKEQGVDSFLEYKSSDSKDMINVDLQLLDFDPQGHLAILLIKFNPKGNLLSQNRKLTTNLTVDFLFKTFNFKESSTLEYQTIKPAAVGSLRDYPLDTYKLSFPLIITNQTNSKIPLNVKLGGSSHLFHIDFKVSKLNEVDNEFGLDPETIIISIEINRPDSVIIIGFVFTILMWAISLSIANNAWDAVFYKREVSPALLGVGVVIIISLPGFRNSQSGIPSMVCILDMLGFFWCISISVISTSSIIFAYALNWKPRFMEHEA